MSGTSPHPRVEQAVELYGMERREEALALLDRRPRTGARLTVFALVRRSFRPGVVLGQATWATLCALLLVALPWSGRTVPQVLFRPALVPNLLSITHDRDKVR